jgi:aspartokinase-like uncharacterized kinase
VIVVKIGGSLYHHPRLGPGLREYLGTLAPSSILIVPGGGEFADAVRKLDVIHGLGEERAHWLALTSLWTAAAFLRVLLPSSECETHPDTARFDSLPLGSIRILDSHMFCRLDDYAPNPLPHSWEVTSDSIASRAAIVYGATRLILLKSVDVPPNTSWSHAVEQGWVDRHFPHLAVDLRIPVEVINFRRWLDEYTVPSPASLGASSTGHIDPVERS